MSGQHGIEIVNSEKYRDVSYALNATQPDYLDELVQELIDCKARYVYTIIYPVVLNHILEKLYDKGARKGDFVFFNDAPYSLGLIANPDGREYKRLEVGVPMMTFTGLNWFGDLGKEVYDNLVAMGLDNVDDDACNYFDSLYLVANAVDWMMIRGIDYTDPYLLNTTIRSLKVAGCTGMI